jgi:ferredoxin
VDCKACIDACPVACLAVVFNQRAEDRRAWPALVKPRACIACRFCALECPADAIVMKPPSRMTDKEKLMMDGPAKS